MRHNIAFEMAVYPGNIISCSSNVITDALNTQSNRNKFTSNKFELDSSNLYYINELRRSIKLTARSLRSEYDKYVKAFTSHNVHLLRFLQRDALEFEKRGNTCTTLYFDENDDALLAFCSIKCSNVKVQGKSILALKPAIEIAVLCVDDRYRYKGIGQVILEHVLGEVSAIRQKVGVELITLFAIPEAVKFYKKNNFIELKDASKVLYVSAHKKCIPMVLSLSDRIFKNSGIT